MFLDRRRELIEQHVDVQPCIPFGLWLDRAVQGNQARTGSVLDVGLMELVIQIKET